MASAKFDVYLLKKSKRKQRHKRFSINASAFIGIVVLCLDYESGLWHSINVSQNESSLILS